MTRAFLIGCIYAAGIAFVVIVGYRMQRAYITDMVEDVLDEQIKPECREPAP